MERSKERNDEIIISFLWCIASFNIYKPDQKQLLHTSELFTLLSEKVPHFKFQDVIFNMRTHFDAYMNTYVVLSKIFTYILCTFNMCKGVILHNAYIKTLYKLRKNKIDLLLGRKKNCVSLNKCMLWT